MVFTPPTTRVWPALAPPWKRTTTSAHEVKRSTIFPFPSSPHCAPTITTLDMADFLSWWRAAAVCDRRSAFLAQLRTVGRRLQLAFSRRSARLAEDQRDEPSVGHEFSAPGYRGGL